MPAAEMNGLVKIIGKICFTAKIYKNESAFLGLNYINEEDYLVVTYASRIAYVKETSHTNRYGRQWELLQF